MAVANQYGIDLQGIQQGWENSGQNALRALVMGKQMKQLDREEETQSILDENTVGALSGDQGALGKITARKPELGTAIMTRLAALDKDTRERTLKEAPVVARMLGQATDQTSYARAVEGMSAAGISVKGLPMQYDPNFVAPRLMAARAMVDPKFHFQETANGLVAIDQNDPSLTPRTIPGMTPKADTEVGKLIAARDRLRPGDPARAMFDAAINKQTALPKGTRVQLADGTVVDVGGYGDGTGFDKATNNKIEEQIINNSNRLSRVLDISQSLKPEYLTFSNQVSNWMTANIERISPDAVGPEAKKSLAEYTNFRTRAYNDLNQTLKEMSGAAITPQEADRLLKVLGDPSNDSPTQFKTKIEGITKDVRLAQARLLYMRQAGPQGAKGIGDVSLADMPKIIKDRAVKMESALRAKGVGEDQLADQIRMGISQEFGL